MPNLPWLESMHHELERRGLPGPYIERVLRELNDHWMDVVEEQRQSGADADRARAVALERLGRPEKLVRVAVAQYQARSFFGRHPVFTFLLAPVLLTIAMWVALLVLGIATFHGLSSWVGHTAGLTTWTAWTLYYLALWAPPALAALLFCRLAHWSGRGWRWLCATCLVLALLAASFHATLTLPVEPGTGRVTIGFGLSSQTLQMLVPIAVGALLTWQFQRRRLREPA